MSFQYLPSDSRSSGVFVCHDTLKRLRTITWMVYDRRGLRSAPLALFWDKDDAIKYAEYLESEGKP